MKAYEFRILSIAILGLCLLVVAMGMRVESLKHELDTEQRHSKTFIENIPAIPDSISIRRDSCVEGLR